MKTIESLAALQDAFADAASSLEGVDAEAGALTSWLREDRGVTAQARMEIYANAYFARIHAALREDFGALAAALGDDGFHDLAKLYLMAHPPRSFSLRFAGEDFARFLASPVAEAFQRRWPFAADLAALEWAIADLFDAADSDALSRESLARVTPERFGSLRLGLISAHRVLDLEWPVTELHAAWRASAPLPGIERHPTHVLVHRREERVLAREISPTEACALELVRLGASVEDLCAALALEVGEDGAVAAVFEYLERWLAEQLLSGAAPSDS